MQFSEKIYHFKSWQLCISYVIIYLGLMFISNNILLSDSYFYNAYSELSKERIISIMTLTRKYQWIVYFALPISLLLKWVTVAGTIFIGLVLLNQKILFKSCFKIVLISELVLIIGSFIKTIYFIIHKPDSIQDLQFIPFSLIQFFNITHLPIYLVYPLQQSNLFEAMYWILLAVGIQVHINKSFYQSFKIVMLH